jgi:hypothetical protein
VSSLIIPFTVIWIIVFFILFECVLNGIAELSFFDDREFYQDWWNSTTFDEFARKVCLSAAGVHSLHVLLVLSSLRCCVAVCGGRATPHVNSLCVCVRTVPSGTDRCTSSFCGTCTCKASTRTSSRA